MKLQKNDHSIRLTVLGAVGAILYLGILAPSGFLGSARLRSQDVFSRWQTALFPPPVQTDDLLLVLIDEPSQRRLEKKWPWGRGILAEFLGKLSSHQPDVILFDLVFSGATDQDPEQDRILAEAIQKSPPLLLAAYLDRQGDPVFPYPLFTEAGGHVALINKPRDRDLTVRRLFAGVRLPLQDHPLYAMEILAAALHRKIPIDRIHLDPGLASLSLGPLRIPLEPPYGTMAIHYQAPPSRIPTVSFWEILEDRVPPEHLRGKIVLVGSAHEITHDIYPSPLGLLSGAHINANGILTILSERFLRPPPPALVFAAGILFSIAVLLLTFFLPLLPGCFAVLCLIGLGIGAGFAGFAFRNLQTESLSVVLLGVVGWLAGLTYKYALLARQVLLLYRQVVTDPASRAHTGRYFRLRMEDVFRRRSPAQSHGLLVVRTERPSEMLQRMTWEEARKNIRQVAHALGGLQPGGLLGQIEEDHLALWIPGLSVRQAEQWAPRVLKTLQPCAGRLGLGIACLDAGAGPSAHEWIRCAQSAAQRSWATETRAVELYDPQKDGAAGSGGPASAVAPDSASPFDYVASEIEEKNQALEKSLGDLRTAHQELENHFLEVTKSLIMAMDTKDAYTAGHLERVSRYATRLAEMLRLSKEETESIREAALLHDIGKLNMPDEVLHKTGPLTPEEVAVVRQHLELGAKILDPMRFFRHITTLLYHHHERYDGKGYPHGLTGEFIPAGAQVIAIADSFDAMTTHRGYNNPLNVPSALAELRRGAGTQFNPAYVETFAQLIEKEGPFLAPSAPPKSSAPG